MKQYDEGGGVEGLARADSEVREVLPPGVDRTEESDERGLLQRTGLSPPNLASREELLNLQKNTNIMRKNFGVKAWTYPQPVFIIGSYSEDGTPDAMNAAWCGISEENQISLCLSAGHKTTKNILDRKAFTISMATADQVIPCDYVGVVSGNREPNKFEKAGFHALKGRVCGRSDDSGTPHVRRMQTH